MKTKMQKRINEGFSKLIVMVLLGAILTSNFSAYSLTFAQAVETPETATEVLPTEEVAPVVADDSMASDIAKMRAHIKDNNLPQIFLDRLDEFEKSNETAIKENKKEGQIVWDGVPKDGNAKHPFKVVGSEEAVNKKNEKDFEKIISSKKNKIIFEDNFKLAKSQNASVPSLSKLSNTFTAESTSSIQAPSGFVTLANETKESQSIKNKAIELGNNPLNILNFVRESIKYEPYYGSKKGAEATLLEGEGNDADQSALLIALLRAGDASGNNKIPARYKHGVVKLALRDVMDMVGADNPELAAKILGGAKVPYSLYVDQNNSPLFFVVEMFWVEAWIEYGEYGGATTSGISNKEWVPLIPGLVPTYYFRSLDSIDGLISTGFNITTFYENYLHGDYGTVTPIDAFETQVASYVATQEGKDISDAKIVGYRGFNKFEFIPRTLPFSLVTDYGIYENIPNELRHKIQVKVSTTATTFLDHTAYTSDMADSELLITYDPATVDDATFLASFPTIYDVVPLSLLQLKPVFRINGSIIAGGTTNALEINAGVGSTLGLTFFAPRRGSTGVVTLLETEHVEKPTVAGNTEAIGIDTGNVMPPELRPSADTATNSYVKDQKLYRTALNYLDRLEASHDRLAEFTGGAFTDIATRAIIANSLAVTSVSGVPYSFSWKGLNIDSSSYVRYHSRFGNDANKHMKEFLYLFGLEASLDEASIFEDDYGVDAVSTVKAIRQISQGIIPGQVLKITSTNSATIDTMNISSTLKTKFHTAISEGDTIYTPKAPFTRGNWTGMVYITLDATTGAGSYVIGEGLNGGYTVETPAGSWVTFWTNTTGQALSATILLPTTGAIFTQGDTINSKIEWKANYTGPLSWTDHFYLDANDYPKGDVILKSGYGTNKQVTVIVKEQNSNEFIEGMADVASIQFSLEGIVISALGEGVGVIVNKIGTAVVKKAGATIAGKFVAKVIPIPTNWIKWAITGGLVAYQNYPDFNKCISSDTHLDDDIQLIKSSYYFCGKMSAKTALIVAGVATERLASVAIGKYSISKLVANKIATGHALTQHLSEFSDLGINTEEKLIQHVAQTIRYAPLSKDLLNGRKAYYDEITNTIVIYDPNHIDLGTSFRPVNGINYYNNEIQ